ncbi:hypothetical protein ABFS83_02G114200 [Erythranthe nasuta]
MADGHRKPAMSLNQLHSRYLVDLSASQPNKPKPVDDVIQSTVKPNERFDDVPRFDFGTPSPPVQVNDEEPVSKLKESSPCLYGGFSDFDSPSSVLAAEPHESGKTAKEGGSSSETNPTTSGSYEYNTNFPASEPHERGKTAKEDDTYSEINPTIYDSSEYDANLPVGFEHEHIEQESGKIPEEVNTAKETSSVSSITEFGSSFPETIAGEERQTKVRIKGRRRLCKIADSDAEAGKNLTREEEPKPDGISDFDSPFQANKSCKSKGNEIRDILNDLSSRFEILSIEKKKLPKKVELQEPVRSKLYDVTINEGSPEYQAASATSFLLSSDSLTETTKSKFGGTVTNELPQKKNRNADVKDDGFFGKANRTMDNSQGFKDNKFMKAHVKPEPAKESKAYNYKRQEKDCNSDNYAFLSERVDGKQGKFIEVSDDDEADDVSIVDGDVEDFTLSGLKGTYRLTGKMAKMLYPHQREGLKWLWSLHCMGKGGILGDDMGLGKTMQICSFLAGLFHSNLTRRVLIVAPKTLLTHWTNELSTVGLSDKTREYFSTCAKLRHYELQYVLQDKGILLTTYDIVRNNTKALCGDHRYCDDGEDEMRWDYMILDEGHLIKNPSTQRAKSLLQIPCAHRIIISGTPLQNNLKELWALFSFCCPELLGDKKEFKEKYEHFINRGNEKNASDREKRIGSSVAKNLRDCIQPYFLRRMKSEVFQDNTSLSKKNEIIVWLRLTQCQRQLYAAFLNSEIVISACDGSPLAAITILKKICDHPLLLTKRAAEDVLEGLDSSVNQDDQRVAEKLAMHLADVAERFDIVDNHDISCKLSFILSLLADLIPKGHNVLIFSQTRKMLNIIQESLMANQYKYMRIDGTTKIADRAKIVKDFQEGRGAPIFLLTSQVGGLGLTLTNADRVIVVDPAWNPSTDSQSVDRAYRIGQKKDVVVYRLMTCGTVEEKIYRKQVFKGGLFRSATEHKEQIRYFSQQDLKDLFNLPKQGFDISLTQQQLLEEHDEQHIMEPSLKAHVEFLQTLNIAGVSQHSLLFSKAAPVQTIEIEDEQEKLKGSTYVGNASTRPYVERNVDGAQYAYNPKDVKRFQRNSSPDVKEPSAEEIRERINRLSDIFNTVAVSRLPDKGEKIHRQIAALYVQLDQLNITKGNEDDVIEL